MAAPHRHGHWRLRHNTADASVHHRILGPFRRDPARIGAARPARTARRHIEPFSARHPHRHRRLGPVQRHRGCRPGFSHGATGLAHNHPGIDHVGGGAGYNRSMDQAAHPLAQGVDADYRPGSNYCEINDLGSLNMRLVPQNVALCATAGAAKISLAEWVCRIVLPSPLPY